MHNVPIESDREWLDVKVYPRLLPVESGCWEWQGGRTPDGYGKVSRRMKTLLVHRVVYADHHGPIPEGMQIDHLCGNQPCSNPEHLEAVTPRTNSQRWVDRPESKKTHCKHGHPFDDENTRLRQGKWRVCVACQKRRGREQTLRAQAKREVIK